MNDITGIAIFLILALFCVMALHVLTQIQDSIYLLAEDVERLSEQVAVINRNIREAHPEAFDLTMIQVDSIRKRVANDKH